jgi:hypothetical protein
MQRDREISYCCDRSIRYGGYIILCLPTKVAIASYIGVACMLSSGSRTTIKPGINECVTQHKHDTGNSSCAYRLVGRNMLGIWCSAYCTNPVISLLYRVMIQLRFQQETPTNSNFRPKVAKAVEHQILSRSRPTRR